MGFTGWARELRGQDGQSLVIVAISMLVTLGMGALAIDVSSWEVKHHQAQVAADAAALAAANCLADSGAGAGATDAGTGGALQCTSNSDTADATTVAITIAADNGVTLNSSDVSFSSDRVQVTAPNPAPAVLAQLFGIHATVQSAAATAAFTHPTGTSCATAGVGCDFMFAQDSACQNGGPTTSNALAPNGIALNMVSLATIHGRIQTNGNLGGLLVGANTIGPTTYGTGPCTGGIPTTGLVNGNLYLLGTWTGATRETAVMPYPLDYGQDFPACGGSGDAACSGPDGTPPFCTQAAANFTSLSVEVGSPSTPGQIYCAYGTGNPHDPSSWNGAIDIISVSALASVYDSFVAGTISYAPDVNAVAELSACGYSTTGYTASDCTSSVPAPETSNYPVFYAIDHQSQAASGTGVINVVAVDALDLFRGDIYAPNGEADINIAGIAGSNSFIEAQDINATIIGIFAGDGPTAATTTAGPGTDSLVQ